MATIGRNDPCPCGSGRKYKHCCLDKGRVDDIARVRLRRAEARVMEAVVPWALQKFGRPFFEHAWSDFYIDEPPQVDDPFTIPEFESMFMPWFGTLFVRDPHAEVSQPDWPDEPLALHWMRTERPALDDFEREWLVAASRSPYSAFAVDQVDPGRSLDVRDLLTGKRFHVLEQAASQTLEVGHLIFSRVITAGGASVMFGMGPYSFPPDWQIEVFGCRDHWFGRDRPSRVDLEDYDIELRDLYLEFADRARDPTPPRLANTDGDPFELTTLTYALTCPVSEAFAKLLPLATLRGEEHVDDVRRDEAGAVVHAMLAWIKAGNKKQKDWESTVLGHLKLDAGQLVVEVNSAKRGDRIEREIAKRLGASATLQSRTAIDQEEMWRSRNSPPAAGNWQQPDNEEELDTPERSAEIAAIEDELFVRHVRGWVKERVPALGNKTPEQASRTKAGRERLEALVAGFEQMERTGSPIRREALAELRRTLGLQPVSDR